MAESSFKQRALSVVAAFACLIPTFANAAPPIVDDSHPGGGYHSFYHAFDAAGKDTDYNHYTGTPHRKIDPKEVLFCISAKNNITYRCKYGGTVKVKGSCYYVPPKGATGNKAKKTGWQMTGVGQCSSILIQEDLGDRCEITVRACPFITQGKKSGSKALLGTSYLTKATFNDVPLTFPNTPPPFCTPTNGAAPVSISGPPYSTTPFELLDSCTESSPASEVKAITDLLGAPSSAPVAMWAPAAGHDISTAGIIAGLQKTNFTHNHGAIFTAPACDGLAPDKKKNCCENDRGNYWKGFCTRLDYKMAPKIPKLLSCKMTPKDGIFPGPGAAPSSLGGRCTTKACSTSPTTCGTGWTAAGHGGHANCIKDFGPGDIYTVTQANLNPCTGVAGQFFTASTDECEFDFNPSDEDECTGKLSNLSRKLAAALGVVTVPEANGLQVVEYSPDGSKDIYHPREFKLKKGPHQTKAGKAKEAAVEANFFGQQIDTELPKSARLKPYNNGTVSCNDYCHNNGQYWGFKGDCLEPPDPGMSPEDWAVCGPVLGNGDPGAFGNRGLGCYCNPTEPIDATGLNSTRNPLPVGTITNSARDPQAGANPVPPGQNPPKGNGPNNIGSKRKH